MIFNMAFKDLKWFSALKAVMVYMLGGLQLL